MDQLEDHIRDLSETGCTAGELTNLIQNIEDTEDRLRQRQKTVRSMIKSLDAVMDKDTETIAATTRAIRRLIDSDKTGESTTFAYRSSSAPKEETDDSWINPEDFPTFS